MLSEHPEKAAELRAELEAWAAELDPPGLPSSGLNDQEQAWLAHYLPASATP